VTIEVKGGQSARLPPEVLRRWDGAHARAKGGTSTRGGGPRAEDSAVLQLGGAARPGQEATDTGGGGTPLRTRQQPADTPTTGDHGDVHGNPPEGRAPSTTTPTTTIDRPRRRKRRAPGVGDKEEYERHALQPPTRKGCPADYRADSRTDETRQKTTTVKTATGTAVPQGGNPLRTKRTAKHAAATAKAVNAVRF